MAVHLFFTRIVDSVIERIPSALRTADDVLETNLAPFKVLDILGFSGHRVVGVSSKNNKMVNYLDMIVISDLSGPYLSFFRCGPLRENMFTENSDGCFVLRNLSN